VPPTGLFWSYLGVASQTRVSRGVMAKADFKTAAVLQWLGDGGDDAWRDERAADPLRCPRIDAKPSGDLAHAGPSRSRQNLSDSLFQGGAIGGHPRRFSSLGSRVRAMWNILSPKVQVDTRRARVSN
jgi:hypothetical protein